MAKTTPAEVTGVAGLKFEAALAELEKLVASMEAGQLPLEESLTAYRRGVELLQHCQRQLEDAEEKVRVLDNGVLRPLDTLPGNGSGEAS
ncbi:MAG: exodeoxyribonuclease small subunit [Pseudomonadota bacterium]|jgi:exodeoxyribonuclease VII small subunit|nr:exodeoxyribonuclease small subunit [Pseudomonadota bacterium]MDQ5882058.1 exodeoxyribonuclease small subunit [Pseudomonadota bacterium]MDQ5902475.1 exodeoxyribonuclease small subunit [Pseudomonadota bacterium]MDQ5906166.1 exodeoxyribonuclease small subunit [Pseudomonadota bacterium]MDQ5947312.1 exodeoxyribonuclease small subunit [Pseudomonadota bacterium]